MAGGGASLLVPGEVVGSSGKFSQPTKIPGKNYFKVRRLPTRELVATSISVSQDEVVIRNADSGKVMGLKGRRVHMIEQLTETVVSFQRLVVRSRSRSSVMVTVVRVVPGARERLVQITGPGYDNIVQVRSISIISL